MRVVLTLMALSALGCSEPADVVPLIYDACFDVTDCIEAATRCEELAVEFAGLEYINAICTTECFAAGPVSPDCSRALIGRRGSCYPSSVAGGIDDTLICFEPCDTEATCLVGFRCLGADDLCGGNLAACPIDAQDAICVPGPG
jgi:hypothetical protein